MIQLKRIRTRAHVPTLFRDPKRIERHVALIDGYLADSLDLQSAMWKPAKKALRTESSGKCGYCEAPADVTAHCDVEHFRPKSVYWWLALCYDNYVFACQICNQLYKGDAFPVSGRKLAKPRISKQASLSKKRALAAKLALDPLAAPAEVEAWKKRLLAESPDLVDPYFEDPRERFAWEADDILKEVRLVALNPSNARCAAALEAAEQFLGLNREELRQLRYRFYEVFATLHEVYSSNAVPAHIRNNAGVRLSRAMEPGASFAGMARYFIVDVWKLPLAVP